MKKQNILSGQLFMLLLLSSFALFSCFGCAVGDGDDDEEDDGTEQEADFTATAVTDEDGLATVTFDLADGTTKFGVNITADDYYVRFTEVESDNGVNYLDPNGEEVSFADTFFPYINSVSAPSRSLDTSLIDGSKYTVSALVSSTDSGSPVAGQTVTFHVNSKEDTILSGGTMLVNIFYVGDAGQDATTKEVVAEAITQFKSIFESQASIQVTTVERDIDGSTTLASPLYGSSFYKSATASVTTPSVNIFIGGDVSETSDTGDILGISGGIPGPAISSERSAVVVSFFAGAGTDGIYSTEDIRILGETLAHETGHFMGLFHPVDFSGNVVTSTDPLDDTDSCSFITECLSDVDLISNLMFPSPVSDGDGGYVAQNQLTAEQTSVMNRYIVTD